MRYTAMTASICAEFALRSRAMVGIATLTIKASTPNMNCAATTIASTHQRREVSTGLETIWCMGRGLAVDTRQAIPAPGGRRDYLGGKRRQEIRTRETTHRERGTDGTVGHAVVAQASRKRG